MNSLLQYIRCFSIIIGLSFLACNQAASSDDVTLPELGKALAKPHRFDAHELEVSTIEAQLLTMELRLQELSERIKFVTGVKKALIHEHTPTCAHALRPVSLFAKHNLADSVRDVSLIKRMQTVQTNLYVLERALTRFQSKAVN